MIANRWRTLLFNMPSDLPSRPGEEYVSPDFTPQDLRSSALSVWQLLFGHAPDRAYRNYLLYQYAHVVHSSKLKDEVEVFDPRITYWPINANDARWNQYGRIALTRTSGTGDLLLSNVPPADDRHGRSALQIDVTVSGSTLSTQEGSVTLTFSDGLATATLPHWSGLQVHVRQGAAGTWRIEGYLRPKRSPVTVVLRLEDVEPALTEIFDSTDRARAMRDFYAAAKSAPDRLAPVLLALGHQIVVDRGEA
jgi:hypothetical protein